MVYPSVTLCRPALSGTSWPPGSCFPLLSYVTVITTVKCPLFTAFSDLGWEDTVL